ncbi:MAG: J domain-containing protein [Syntrophobacteraceae bacterium]|jgi:hypothetical protein
MVPEAFSETDFRLLGLEPGSKPSEVRQAYRALVKKWHPDRHHSKPYETRALAEKKFREIDEAYRRISRGWAKTPHITERGNCRAASPGIAPHAQRQAKTQARAATASRSRPGIDFRPFFRAKIVLPALLLTAAIFILTQLPSFLPDTAVNTETHNPRIAEDSTGDKNPSSLGPSEVLVGPQASGDLAPSPAPVLPPALLQPQPEPPSPFFTLGSTTSEVLYIQGPPSRVQGQTWTYGLSEIQFRNGRVWAFNNFDGSLRVRMRPGISNDRQIPAHITIGSSEEDVLLVQGTPTRVDGGKWFYGFAELVFKNGRVAEYDNYFGSLRVRLLPSAPTGPEPPGNFFTIGSTPDEVLAIQGTPTSIHGNRWSFNFDVVSFRDGKVHYVTNADGTLRFIAPEKTSDAEGP